MISTTYKKLYKVSEKHEKLYRLATKMLSDVELDREELSPKFDEANQTIEALRFENNFLVESVGKSGFVSYTKHIVEATNMDLFHS